ncbi:Hypothetical_protein [Hexamita inflata]|uniref:Hypothetical_protein n=1 Tax=Hexamita inflata TaxID=28002 RepID=A0AA86N7T1_9EUKA|nr:Hypothetical protein HINF_LOCUS1946 [Hexamita inflata]CAI9934671.1 Hypothetical protein HINF_LOCUS22316 [Hexamita inflata]
MQQKNVLIDIKKRFQPKSPLYSLRYFNQVPVKAVFESIEPVSCEALVIPGVVLKQIQVSKYKQKTEFYFLENLKTSTKYFNKNFKFLNYSVASPCFEQAPLPIINFTGFDFNLKDKYKRGSNTVWKFGFSIKEKEEPCSCYLREIQINLIQSQPSSPI